MFESVNNLLFFLFLGIGPFTEVWILGSSIVRDAFTHAKCKLQNLNLVKNVHVWWQGYGGLLMANVGEKLDLIDSLNSETPSILILHCGGNDLGKRKTVNIINSIENTLREIHIKYPFTKIVFSQILPRKKWRYSCNNKAMDHARRRVNSFVKNKIIELGGTYLKHDITKADLKGDVSI